MRKLETVMVPIRRDYESVYGLLSDPKNYPRWSPIPDGMFAPIDDSGYRWLVDLPRGRRIMHFTPPNEFGVLDYTIHSESGEFEYITRLRVLPNDEGTTLVAHFMQRPGLSDLTFRSELDWATNDLKSIAATIEKL